MLLGALWALSSRLLSMSDVMLPIKDSLISNKERMNSEVGREADRIEPDNTSVVVTIKRTGHIWFPLPIHWKGTDLSVFISAEK